MTSPSIVRLTNIATEYSYENLEFLKEAIPSVSTTATPCMYHHVNPFASNCHDYPPHEFVLHCPNELLPEIFHAIQSAINGQDAHTYNYEFQHSNGLNDYGVQATICHADYALPLTWTSTLLHSYTILHTYLTTSALLDPWTILLSANYNNFADFVQALRKQVQLSNTALVFVYTACTTYHIHPANESTGLSTAELLIGNRAQTNSRDIAMPTFSIPRCFNNFITPNIVTTMTSLVFYSYEFDELSTNEHTTSAFQLQLSWTMTIIVVAAYVLMIAANGILLQTKVGNFYMSTQWSMESTFVKLLLIV